jgi:hypothetical protein
VRNLHQRLPGCFPDRYSAGSTQVVRGSNPPISPGADDPDTDEQLRRSSGMRCLDDLKVGHQRSDRKCASTRPPWVENCCFRSRTALSGELFLVALAALGKGHVLIAFAPALSRSSVLRLAIYAVVALWRLVIAVRRLVVFWHRIPLR